MSGEEFIGNLSNLAGNQTGEILRNSFGLLGNVPGINLVVRLFQIAGALAILYLVFLIIRTFSGWNSAKRLKIIAKNTEDINRKMDILISKYEGKASKKK